MKKVSDYRRHVEECKMLARQSGSEQHRQMLLSMAETWEQLAQAREQKLLKDRSAEGD